MEEEKIYEILEEGETWQETLDNSALDTVTDPGRWLLQDEVINPEYLVAATDTEHGYGP